MTATAPHSQPTNPDARQDAPMPKLVMGEIICIGPDDEEAIPYDEAVIHFEDDEESEISVHCRGALRLAAFIVEAVNSHASLTARVEELERDLADYKEAAGVEADLRREFAGRVGLLEYSFRNVDELDWKHLLSFIPESGHGKFWKAVFEEVRAALSQSSGEARTEQERGR